MPPSWPGSSPESWSSSWPCATPSSARCTRSPAGRAGSRTSRSAAWPGFRFGWFAYLQAVTIAPVECFAFMNYASYFWPSIDDPKTSNVTGVGFAADHRADGHLHRGQLPGHAHLRPGQQRDHVVEGRGPRPVHHRAADPVARRQLHGRRPGLHAGRDQGPVRGAPGSGHHLRLLRLRAGRPAGRRDQGPGAQPAAGNHPRRPIGTTIYCLLQVAFIGAMSPSHLVRTASQR